MYRAFLLYQTKLKVSDEDLATIQINPDRFHPEWNYTIIPSVE
jgi:hypothetical protein